MLPCSSMLFSRERYLFIYSSPALKEAGKHCVTPVEVIQWKDLLFNGTQYPEVVKQLRVNRRKEHK